jgi:hypothetical protein
VAVRTLVKHQASPFLLALSYMDVPVAMVQTRPEKMQKAVYY